MESQKKNAQKFHPNPRLKLMDQVREVLQALLGHVDVKTTEIYTHVMARDIRQLQSPLDILLRQGEEQSSS